MSKHRPRCVSSLSRQLQNRKPLEYGIREKEARKKGERFFPLPLSFRSRSVSATLGLFEEFFGYLYGIQGCAFANLIADDPNIVGVGAGDIFAHPAD